MEKESLNEKIALDPSSSFLLIASMKVAVQFKEMGKDENDYMTWCKEIWKSVEMNDINFLKEAIESKMKSDMSYFKSKGYYE